MIPSKLKKAIKDGNVILFVGSGVSSTLGLPMWNELIAKIGKDLGFEPELFNQYGDNLLLAEYYHVKKHKLGNLCNWMSENWEVSKNEIRKSLIYKNIVKLSFPIIYTTNYDHCIERAYEVYNKKYTRIIGVEDIVDIKPKRTQIIKLHGDYDKKESIVLTESSYFNRLNFESPLDIKLRSDILGKTILFVGYSMSDINIRLLLYKLNKIWEQGDIKKRPTSFLFLATPNEIQQAVLKSREIETIIGEKLDRRESLETFLKELAKAKQSVL